MKFNFQLIINVLGLLALIIGFFMLLTLPFSLSYDLEAGIHSWKPILAAAGVTIAVGGGAFLISRRNLKKDIQKREGYIIVTLGWLVISFFGSLPFFFSGEFAGPYDNWFQEYTNCFFETMSGFSTTGASILTNIEGTSKGLLFWRSLTHWLGGMGIIVLTIAILPLLGIGGMQLFVAEAPGPEPDKLHPRIKETAKRLWVIYFVLTLAQMLLLMAGEMDFFEAINHAMATMATGGFSTKNDSIASYGAYTQYIIIIFMFLAGTNFTLSYFGMMGKFKKIWQNEEFKTYLFSTIFLVVVVTATIMLNTDMGLEEATRDAAFQVISIFTTTGFASDDYTSWHTFATTLFFILLFTGASAGSTSGGIKVVRHLILIKNSFAEFTRQLHPSAVVPVRFNKKAVPLNIIYNISAFILIYLVVFFIGAAIMSTMDIKTDQAYEAEINGIELPADVPRTENMDFDTAVGATIACLGNIGPGIGHVGPKYNFNPISTTGKWFLSFLMLLGRLELFTVLILFTPHFWRRK